MTQDHEPNPLPPIAVDFDGTLIRSDSLHEAAIHVVRWPLGEILALVGEMRRGRAAFKRLLTAKVPLDPSLLPYNRDLLTYLHDARQNGRHIGLFTASDQSVADQVADHLAIFDVAYGSDGTTNLSGPTKADAIRAAFGDRFTYAGDASVDRPIFAAAETVILVGPVERLRAALPAGKAVEASFPQARPSLLTWAKALRLQHWVKNLLVFVAPILGFEADSTHVVVGAAVLFLLLGLLASATYIINDLLDLAADRQHPLKHLRPFAAGTISIRDGAIVACVLIALVAGAGGFLLPLATLATLAVYFGLTLAYSLALKRMPMIDVVVLAALFTLRVWSGGTLLPTPASPWLLTFSMLFFLGLAMIKRYAELERVLRTDAELGRARGYTSRDLPILLATGVASGMSAIVIFTIYLINEQYPRHVYTCPTALWGIMPALLVWTLRVWHLSVHGRMDEDPIVFALKDRFSLVLGGVVAVLLVIAWI